MTLKLDGRGVGASFSGADFRFRGAGVVAFSLPFKLGFGGGGCAFFCGTGEPLTRPAENFEGGSTRGFFATRSGAFIAEAYFGIYLVDGEKKACCLGAKQSESENGFQCASM